MRTAAIAMSSTLTIPAQIAAFARVLMQQAVGIVVSAPLSNSW